MTEGFESRWAGRTAFSEVAEALGVPTSDIVMVAEHGDRTFVFYTKGTEGELEKIPAYMISMARDADGILQRDSVETVDPDFFARAQKGIGEVLREKLGEPGGSDE